MMSRTTTLRETSGRPVTPIPLTFVKVGDAACVLLHRHRWELPFPVLEKPMMISFSSAGFTLILVRAATGSGDPVLS